MRKLVRLGLVSGVTFFLFVKCDPCKKLAKSKSIAEKDSAAYCYFNNKNFESAALIFEELIGLYRGTARVEKVTYFYALAKYNTGDYITAAFYFNEYIQQFPVSTYSEEASYMIAQCYYMQSNTYELDQAETLKAIEYFKLFLQLYPKSERANQANNQIKELQRKLAQKLYNQANVYLKIYEYQAATIAFKNLIKDYPDSPFREEATFKLFKAALLYALNSIEEKKEQRLVEAISYFLKFESTFPQSKFLNEARVLYSQAQQQLKKLKKTN
ncbi:MAG: outer membrane protein assembly factor BamD [Bacteroidia bacterium]|nr:outer membrane protein assembly factor BamD [Bacteroidia bacterium]MDW8157689.1 outer membrane protein assembly factor BamD [Bacteroidia bacterium]